MLLAMNSPCYNRARFYFHGQLAGLLRRPADAGVADCPFVENPAIKDTIEAAGVPHTEVDLIYANGLPVDFSYRLQPGDRIDIYPPGLSPPANDTARPPLHLSPPVPDPVRFVLDVHLGKLARRMRLLGFDTLYRNDYDDAQIAALGCEEQRIILTRDRGLLKRRLVEHGYLLRSTDLGQQVYEVVRRYGLLGRIVPLRRCPRCNGQLEAVGKQEVLHRLEIKTARYYTEFVRCCQCGKLYWQGSHYARITAWINGLHAQRESGSGRA